MNTTDMFERNDDKDIDTEDLGTLQESFNEYQRLVTEHKANVGNLEWSPEWEASLTRREVDTLTLWNHLLKIAKRNLPS